MRSEYVMWRRLPVKDISGMAFWVLCQIWHPGLDLRGKNKNAMRWVWQEESGHNTWVIQSYTMSTWRWLIVAGWLPSPTGNNTKPPPLYPDHLATRQWCEQMVIPPIMVKGNSNFWYVLKKIFKIAHGTEDIGGDLIKVSQTNFVSTGAQPICF